MGFSKKRGRPRIEREKNDKGTPELRRKIAKNKTIEPIDLCLKKGLISEHEHQAAIRLRWLYTLRFGSPHVSAYDPDKRGASCFRNDDDEWIKMRHVEYENALVALQKIGAKRLVMNICIFNFRAAFLTPPTQTTTHYHLRLRHAQFSKFKHGLEVLAKVMGKRS
jgi:hypothetical protein